MALWSCITTVTGLTTEWLLGILAIQSEQYVLPLKYLEISYTVCFAGRRQEGGIRQQKGDDVTQCHCCWNLSCACSVIFLNMCFLVGSQTRMVWFAWLSLVKFSVYVCMYLCALFFFRLSELLLQEHCGSSFIFRKKFCSAHKDIFSIVQRIL